MESLENKPAWMRDMRYCRLLALRVIQDIRHAMDRPGGEEGAHAKAMLGDRESLADGLVKMGTFLMKWHAFEHGLENQPLQDGESREQPFGSEDTAIMEDYLVHIRKAGG